MPLGFASSKRKSNGLACPTKTQLLEKAGMPLHFHPASATDVLHGFHKHPFVSALASLKQAPCSQAHSQV